MKNKRISMLVFFGVALIATLDAQHHPGFTIGLNSDLFSVPLTPGSAGIRAGGVEVGYAFSPVFTMSVGWENSLLLDADLSGYESMNGVALGAGYRLWNDASRYTSLTLNAQLVKGFENSEDFSAGAGLRWYLSETFFLGTGVRYDHWKTTPTIVRKENSLNWYWQLGLRFRLGKKYEE